MSDLEFEPDRVPRKLLIVTSLVTVAISVALSFVAWGILAMREAKLRPSHDWPEARLGPPRNDVYERRPALPSIADAQRERLARWRWIDRAHGVVRMPIDRAMEIVAKQSEEGAQ